MKITELLNAQPTTHALERGAAADQDGDEGMYAAQVMAGLYDDSVQCDASRKSSPPLSSMRKMDMASLDLFAQRQRVPSNTLNATLPATCADARPMPTIEGLLQRSYSHTHTDLVPPLLQHAAPMETTTPSPRSGSSTNEENGDDNDDEPIAATVRKQRRAATKPPAGRRPTAAATKKPTANSAADALTALAHAAVESVAEPPPPPLKTKRRGAAGKPAPLTEDEKRAKQRLLVKKSYYRKIDTLNTLRERVAQLEKEYADVASAAQKSRSLVIQQQLQRHSILALIDASAETQMLQSFQELAVSIDQLRRENENLRTCAMEQSKARTRAGIMVHEEFQDQNKRGSQYATLLHGFPVELRSLEEQAAVERAEGASVSLASSASSPRHGSASDAHPTSTRASTKTDRSSPRAYTGPAAACGKQDATAATATPPIIHMTPMTEDECIEVVRDAYAEIMQFRTSSNVVSSGSRVFGWQDRRRVRGDYVQFALEKTFLFRTAQQVATNTWRVLSTDSGVNRIYSSSIRATFHFVQRVTEHNVVFYRTMERVGQNVLLKSLILASLVETENGYMVLFRSIDPLSRNVRDASGAAAVLPGPPRDPHATGTSADAGHALAETETAKTTTALHIPARKEIWIDMFSWGVFEPAGPNGEHCTDFFGGFVPATIATSASFWMMEVLLIAVRCESECVGPLFILPPDATKLEAENGRGLLHGTHTAAVAVLEVRDQPESSMEDEDNIDM